MKISNIIIRILIISLFFFTPLQFACLTGNYLYILVLIYNFYTNKRNLIDYTITAVYCILNILQFGLQIKSFTPHIGTIIYFSLFLAATILLASKKPFTAQFSKIEKTYNLHDFIRSGIWCFLFLLAGVLSVLLKPDVLYIVLPIGLMIFGSIVSAVYNPLLGKIIYKDDSI